MTEMYPGQPVSEEIAGLWRGLGSTNRTVTLFGVRFDRIDADIAELKTDVTVLKDDVAVLKTDVAELKVDVAVLKTDVRETKEQLNRFERASESRFNRLDAQLERLVGLIQRDELKKS